MPKKYQKIEIFRNSNYQLEKDRGQHTHAKASTRNITRKIGVESRMKSQEGIGIITAIKGAPIQDHGGRRTKQKEQ